MEGADSVLSESRNGRQGTDDRLGLVHVINRHIGADKVPCVGRNKEQALAEALLKCIDDSIGTALNFTNLLKGSVDDYGIRGQHTHSFYLIFKFFFAEHNTPRGFDEFSIQGNKGDCKA